MSNLKKDQFDTLNVESKFKMFLLPSKRRKIQPSLESRIEKIWLEEGEELGDALFEGEIFSAKEVSTSFIKGEFVPYKHFVACQRDPLIAQELGIEAVAVTGMTSLEDSGSILVGRRSRNCLQDRSCYELLPSGGIDADCLEGEKVLFEEQLLRELEEETNIGREMVRNLRPYLLTFDKERKIWELCLHVVVAKEAESHVSSRKREHDEVLWLSRRDVIPFLQMHRGSIVPLADLLLRQRPTGATRLGV